MVSPVQRNFYRSEDEFLLENDELSVSPTLRKGQLEPGIKEVDIASAQVSQRIFQQSPADNHKKENTPLKSKVAPPALVLNNNKAKELCKLIDNLNANFELGKLSKLVENLEADFKKWRQHFQGLVTLKMTLLESCEYLSANKENILQGVTQLNSVPYTQVKSWLNKGDTVYKWMDDSLHMLEYIVKYYRLYAIQKELKNYYQQLQKLQSGSSSGSDGEIEKLQKYIDFINLKIKKEKQETWNKGVNKTIRLVLTKPTPLVLEHVVELSSKTAIKICKIVFSFFKEIAGIWDALNAQANQNKWLYHLQPRVTVNIYSNAPDQEEEELEITHANEHKNYRSNLEKFLESLKNCNTTQEVEKIFNEAGIDFEVPSTLTEFKKQFKNLDFQRDLMQKYYRANLKKFLESLKNCNTTQEVKKIFKEIGIGFEVPSTITEFKKQFKNSHFQRDLMQEYSYYIGKRSIMAEEHIHTALRAKMARKKRLINKSLPFINEQIIACQHLSWPEIEAHFANLHIPLDAIQIKNSKDPFIELSDEVLEDSFEESEDLYVDEELPISLPTTKLEWDQCIQNEEFVQALAAKWIDYQEEKAQLFWQAIKQCLLSKHSVEAKFLDLRLKQEMIGLVSTAIQFAICMPYVKVFALTSALEVFSKDFAKAGFPLGGFYLFMPLYPKFNFKLESILLNLHEHFFAIKYKPNEYSLKSYKLTIQIRMIELMMSGHQILLLLKQILLWINMRLIENCMMGLKKIEIGEDDRFKQMLENYEQHRINYKQHVEELHNSLKQLKIEDTKLILNPQYRKSQEKSSQSKEALKDPLQNDENFDPLYEIAVCLEDADFEYFPAHILEKFEENFGFKLTEENKENLLERLEAFFSESEINFIDSFNSNRFNYLNTYNI